MSSETTRLPDLEIALIAKIREKGSKDLLNALEDCEIRVERREDDTYAVMSFPIGYSKTLEWDLCVEVELLGFSLEIAGCDIESANRSIIGVSATQTFNYELINQLLDNPQLEEGERLLLTTIKKTKWLEPLQIRDFRAIISRLRSNPDKGTDSNNSTH